jgi:hypothetical protein
MNFALNCTPSIQISISYIGGDGGTFFHYLFSLTNCIHGSDINSNNSYSNFHTPYIPYSTNFCYAVLSNFLSLHSNSVQIFSTEPRSQTPLGHVPPSEFSYTEPQAKLQSRIF